MADCRGAPRCDVRRRDHPASCSSARCRTWLILEAIREINRADLLLMAAPPRRSAAPAPADASADVW
ncbi:MAG: hypothetical protein ACLUEK_01320 [Oscillospiraceae bacterium]